MQAKLYVVQKQKAPGGALFVYLKEFGGLGFRF